MNPALLEPAARLAAGTSEECVAFTWEALPLRGVLSLPAGEVRRLLLTVHGWASVRGGPSGLLARLCRQAAGEGWAALRFDLPGRGESEGAYGETDLDDMIDAVLAACGWLRGRFPGRPLYLAGICSGANVALAAAALGEEVAGVLALSALPYQEHRGTRERLRRSWGHLKTYFRKALRLSTWKRLFRGEVDLAGVGRTIASSDASPGRGRNLKESRRDIPALLRRYRGRLLLAWGEKDEERHPAERYFRRLLEQARLDTFCLPGADHNYYGREHHRAVFRLLERLADDRVEAAP